LRTLKMSEPQFTLLLIGADPDHSAWSADLEREGYAVEVMETGANALHRLRRGPVDLVLVASELPDTDAFAVLKSIRELYSPAKLPIVMVTSGRRTDEIVRAFDLGANDYIAKPVDFQVLLVRIQARLRGHEPVTPVEEKKAPTSGLEIEAGTVLDGKYRLESQIGRGHYGVVYRATHLTLERPVAVKLLHPNYYNRDESLERFRREGISACQIEHPNAVSVLDYSVTEGGLPYLVMELLEGRSLEDEIRDNAPLHPVRCAVILLPICEVLAEAHSLGIIHRDIKPQNIFLQEKRRSEVVKVLDFGIAKLVDDAILGQELTVDGSGPGTPTYMAPERFSEAPYDCRVDVYSLGVLLYEMLTGRPPFHTPTGNPIKLALMHMSEAPAPLCDVNPHVPRPLDKVVRRALEKDFTQRPWVGELAQEFFRALGMELPKQYVTVFRQTGSWGQDADA